MAHVFYGDKKPKSLKDDATAGTSWADQMKYVFIFMEWWNRYRIYRFFDWGSLRLMNAVGNIAGKIALMPIKTYKQKLKSSFHALYRSVYSEEKFDWFRKAHASYLGKLFFAFMSGIKTKPLQKRKQFFRFENLDLLDRELKKKKGVIMPLTHLGELTQAIWALATHPKKYTIATIVYVPHMGLYIYANDPGFSNVYLYASTSYRKIAHYLEAHLKNNHIVMIYYDFGHPSQLRVPFWYGKFPYLIHTPQSVIRLHRKTHASILPCLNLPDGIIGKTYMKFIDNSEIMRISENNWNANPKRFHGILSMELNRVFAPYLRAYGHVWEQILDFAPSRIADHLEFDANIYLHTACKQAHRKMHEIIDMSYEPHRPDQKLKQIITNYMKTILNLLPNKGNILSTQKIHVDLSQKHSLAELKKIISIIQEHCVPYHFKLDQIFHDFISSIDQIQSDLIQKTSFDYFNLQ